MARSTFSIIFAKDEKFSKLEKNMFYFYSSTQELLLSQTVSLSFVIYVCTLNITILYFVTFFDDNTLYKYIDSTVFQHFHLDPKPELVTLQVNTF